MCSNVFDNQTLRPFAATADSGWGLVKTLVEMHGGDVSAESDGEGMGATCFVTLPLSAAKPPGILRKNNDRRVLSRNASAAIRGCLPASKCRSSMTSSMDERSWARILEECAADVQLAGSAEEALRLFESFAPEVLVRDIGADVDGYQLTEQVRALGGRGRTVPAAVLTALARAEDRTRALLAGYQTHVAKPVDPVELIAAVAALATHRYGGAYECPSEVEGSTMKIRRINSQEVSSAPMNVS